MPGNGRKLLIIDGSVDEETLASKTEGLGLGLGPVPSGSGIWTGSLTYNILKLYLRPFGNYLSVFLVISGFSQRQRGAQGKEERSKKIFQPNNVFFFVFTRGAGIVLVFNFLLKENNKSQYVNKSSVAAFLFVVENNKFGILLIFVFLSSTPGIVFLLDLRLKTHKKHITSDNIQQNLVCIPYFQIEKKIPCSEINLYTTRNFAFLYLSGK